MTSFGKNHPPTGVLTETKFLGKRSRDGSVKENLMKSTSNPRKEVDMHFEQKKVLTNNSKPKSLASTEVIS